MGKPGLSPEQHRRLAEDLQELRKKFVEIEVGLYSAYSLETGELANRCWKQIDQLRCHLDDLAHRENENPDQPVPDYFGAVKAAGNPPSKPPVR